MADTSSLRASCFSSFAEAIKISICEMKHEGSFRGVFAGENRPPEKPLCVVERCRTLTPISPTCGAPLQIDGWCFPLIYCSFLRHHSIKKAQLLANDRHVWIAVNSFPFKTKACQDFWKQFSYIWLQTSVETEGRWGAFEWRKWESFKIPAKQIHLRF